MHKEAQKSTAKNAGKQTPKESAKISVNLNGSDGNKEKAKITVNLQPREYGTDATKDHNADKDSAKNGQKPHHRRGHRGGRKHANKSQKDGLPQKTQARANICFTATIPRRASGRALCLAIRL